MPRFSADTPAADATGHVEAMALYAGQGVGSCANAKRQQASLLTWLGNPGRGRLTSPCQVPESSLRAT